METVRDGETGWTAPPGDVQAWAELLDGVRAEVTGEGDVAGVGGKFTEGVQRSAVGGEVVDVGVGFACGAIVIAGRRPEEQR